MFNRITGKFVKYKHKINHKRLLRRAERLDKAKTRLADSNLIKSMTEHSRGHALASALCMRNHKAFLAQRVLLRRRCSRTSLYLIQRILQHAPQPGRSLGLRNLKRVFKIRDFTWPSSPRPLVIKHLAQPDFKQNLTKFLRKTILMFKHTCLPLSIPAATMTVEAGYKTVANILYNFKDVPITHDPDSIPCTCQEALRRFPNLLTSGGHLASSASLLTEYLTDPMMNIICNNSTSTGVFEPLQAEDYELVYGSSCYGSQ